MWFGKNIMTKLGLVLAMAVPALAADVAPLEFEGATASDYQAYWNKLMSFKMWGTDTIYLGRAQMPSLSGAIGTARNLTLKDDRHFLGGPIYVGGNFTGGNGTDTIVSGPVRVNGTFDAGTNHNVFHGTYCVGAADADAQRDIENTGAHHYGDTHVDYFGEKGYDAPKGVLNEGCNAIEEVPTYLSIPDVKDIPADAAVMNGFTVSGVKVIDVPPIDGDKKMYDFYVNGGIEIADGNNKLIIRMQSSRSLARFFLNTTITLHSQSVIQVVYVDEGAQFEYANPETHLPKDGSYGKWTNVTESNVTYVDNKDYAGNLLFHCKGLIDWPAMNGGAYAQGSFLSLDTIKLGSNLVLAGQLLGTYVKVQNEFDGKSFRYVPFDPPVLEPTAGGGNILYEGHTSDNVKIELDKDHENNITFDYCFQFEGTVAVGSDYAMKADIADNLPIYDPATKTCSGTPLSSGFKSGELTLEKPIVLHVEDDDDLEHEFEEFKIWILNLDGAVLANGEHDGYITLKIKDNDAKPFGADYEVIGTEDVPYYFDAFTVTNAKGNPVADYSVKIESLPSAGSLVLVNAAGQDSVILTKGDVIPSSAISSDHDVGKFVLRFDDDDYTEGPAPDPVKAIDRYNFEFRVVDKGNASEEAYKASVLVAPVNDAPVAQNTEFTIPENSVTTKTDTTFATSEAKDGAFDATDVDDPVLTYKFDDTFDAENTEDNYNAVTALYGIDPATGKIFLNEGAEIDYESADSVHTIRVVITDKSASTGNLADILSTKITATIKIADVEEKPEFPNKNPELKVDENSVKDTEVGAVTAEDDDCKDKNCTALTYVVVADTNAAHKDDVSEFKIDSKTGMITLVNDSTLNYETKNTYYVLVIAYDGDPKDAKTLSDTARVKIEVQDVNDKPLIENQEFAVVENATKGTVVDKVVASDEDKWSKLTYAIEDVPDATEEVAKFFSIDADGVITVSADGDGVLDYEVKDTYEIVVIVTDNGEEYGKTIGREFENLSDTAVITIKIKDEPEKPGFDDKYPVLAVDENSPKNTEVGVVTADDDDCKDKVCDALTYAVVADTNAAHVGDISEFKIDSKTGKITLVNDSTLDYEKKDTYYVLVIAYDGDPKDTKTLSDTARVKIEVQDVNDKPELADHEFEVPENAKVNQVVDKVNVFDQDTWAKHTFKLVDIPGEEPVANIFSINAEGVIKVAKENSLNYEVKDTYVFYVIATDNGPDKGFDALSDTATITLKIKDVPEPPYIIPECEGDACIEICKGDKCEVCVGESCHEICVENCDEPYGGDPTKVLTVSVKENSLTGYKVMSYLVTDEDLKIGHTKGLEASLKNTNESGADSLFEASMEKDEAGNWRVVVYVTDGTKLDYEKVKEIHNVTIYVKDKDDPTDMGDSLLRVIKVVDVNEAPVADDATFTPEENLPKGTVIGTLVARDPDSKNVKFSTLTYTIDEAGIPFAIDNKGVITVKDSAQLNYEKNPEFTFHVTVSDGQLSDNAKVTVKLKDVPEKPYIIPDCDGVNCPDNCEGEECGDGKDDAKDTCLVNCTEVNEHKDVPTTIGVKEMTAKDHVVLAYKVADEDVGDVEKIKMEINVLDESTIDNGTKFTDLFEYFYDKTKHQVVVKVKDSDKLDYEALRAKSGSAPDPEYKISIVVNDNRGTETQKDSVIRVIRILDVNEAPSFEVEPCVIAEGNEIGDSLGHVERPSDPDQFSKNPEFYTNYFKLTGGNTELFDLKRDPNDPMKIVLVAKVEFDCESGKYVCDKDGVYSVELTYGDTTLNTVYSDLKVPVTIRDINEKPTVLTDTVKVKENAPKGTVVDTVKWKDVDKFDSEMQFKIAEDPTDCFDIGSKSGIITVKKDKCSALDYEKTTIIPIKVAVTDSLGKGITVTKPITVKVLNVNEAPSIVKETFVVDEDAKKGSVVDTVKATDPDKDPKYNKLIYKVIGGDTATFKIDSITGIVTLKDSLDYETKNKYEIVVRVFDGEFADTATVPIYVNNKDEKTEVKITLYDDSTKVWHDPDTVYTNSPGRELCWVQGRSDRDLKDTCINVHIKKDTVIVIRYKDPTTDSYGVDSLVIFFSNAAPVVTIEGDQDANLANNFYTIIENTDKADTNLYVNERKKDVRVTVKDPASKTDTSFVVNLKLETVNVPQKTLDKVNTIVKENSFILNENPKGGVTRTPVNGNEVKVSYKEVLGKDTVTVSYMTDANGDPVMVPVVNDKGKIDSIEVMTVSYNTVIDGKTVTVSFVVNSVTGEVLVKDSNGTLMESGASKVASSSSSKGNTSSSSSSSSGSTSYVTEGMFQITYSQKDALGNSTTVTYSVNEKGKLVQNSDGDSGYAVSYTYTNKYGNAATQSLYIVLDQKGPTVEILKPVKGQVIRSNYVEVVWTVNGVTQDTLTVQGLDKGPNYIKRFYRDKAGNEAADTVLVIMKDSKDVDIAVVKPVTEMNPEEVKEYYEENPPEEGETFAVSILNPTSGKEVETLKGGTFDTKKGSGEELYPGKDKKHLGPTLALDVKLPTIKDGEGNTGLGGLATLDDLILPNGKISNIGIGIDTSKLSDELKREYKEYTVEEYVEKFCEDGTKVPSDFSKFNMYNTKMQVKIWVYTSLGSFVDYFSFSQDMNDPDYTNDAGKLKMFFEMKPDRDGFVKADNGKMMGTGAYLYKVEATIRSTLRCTILDEAVLHDKPNAKRKGDKIKSSDDLLKPFGYKRPKTK